MKSSLLLSIILIFFGWNSNAQWVAVNTGITNLNVIPMAVNGTNHFAGTYGGGVFLSTNGGTSWSAVNNGLTTPDIFSMTVSGSNVYAGSYGGGVFMSSNNGTSWTAVNNGITNLSIYAMAASGSTVYAGTTGGGVFKTTNNGTSWAAVNTGLTNLSVVTLYSNGSNLYAGTTGGGAFLSTDSGATWTAINTGLTSTTVRSFTSSGSNLYAGTAGGGIFISTNNGASWTASNSGLTNMTVWCMTPVGSDIFAGTNGGGVFLSTNNGASWTAVNTGLTASPDVWSIAINGTYIYAGMNSGPGVYRRPLSELVAVSAGFNYNSTDYCANATDPTPTITGSPGGVFSSTAGLTIDASTGEIDVSTSTPGTYVVNYSIGGSSSDQTVTINAVDDATFAYNAVDFCSDGTNPFPVVVPIIGGVFSSSTAQFVNTAIGEIDLSASGIGSHIITFTTSGVCSNSFDLQITINSADDASFTYDNTNYCKNGSNTGPIVIGTGGGTFSSAAGLVLNSSTGQINVSASSSGMYVVTYQTTGICPDLDSINIQITEVDVSTSLNGVTISASTQNAAATFQWLDCDNGLSPIIGETGSSFTPTTNGNYAVQVIENTCADTSACQAITTIGLDEQSLSDHFSVYPNPTDGKVFIKFDSDQSNLRVNVYSVDGKLIQSNTFETSTIFQLAIEEATGVYLLEITDEAGRSAVVRMVKE